MIENVGSVNDYCILYCFILGQGTVETVASIHMTTNITQYLVLMLWMISTTSLRWVKEALIFKQDNSAVLIV